MYLNYRITQLLVAEFALGSWLRTASQKRHRMRNRQGLLCVYFLKIQVPFVLDVPLSAELTKKFGCICVCIIYMHKNMYVYIHITHTRTQIHARTRTHYAHARTHIYKHCEHSLRTQDVTIRPSTPPRIYMYINIYLYIYIYIYMHKYICIHT